MARTQSVPLNNWWVYRVTCNRYSVHHINSFLYQLSYLRLAIHLQSGLCWCCFYVVT